MTYVVLLKEHSKLGYITYNRSHKDDVDGGKGAVNFWNGVLADNKC
jgi:hypothetical protein